MGVCIGRSQACFVLDSQSIRECLCQISAFELYFYDCGKPTKIGDQNDPFYRNMSSVPCYKAKPGRKASIIDS